MVAKHCKAEVKERIIIIIIIIISYSEKLKPIILTLWPNSGIYKIRLKLSLRKYERTKSEVKYR